MSTVFFFKRISKKNKEARAKMTIPGGHGSKSIVAHVYDHISYNNLYLYDYENIIKVTMFK